MFGLTLILALLAPLAQADGLIQVQGAKPVVKKAPTNRMPTSLLSSIWQNPRGSLALPNTNDGKDYERWFLDVVESRRRYEIGNKAYFYAADGGIRCVHSDSAFGFERISDTDYKVNCIAGRKKNYLIEYRMQVNYSTAGCNSESKIHQFFQDPNNRNRAGALRLYNELLQCTMQAVPADPANAIVKLEQFDKSSPVNIAGDNDPKVNTSRKSKYSTKSSDNNSRGPACVGSNPLCQKDAQ